ncbi:MAG: ArnT family glycosyltransferase [Chloroflexaceae bacterium]
MVLKAVSVVDNRRTSCVALIVCILFLLALAPRMLTLGGFLTVDEPDKWFVRSHEFRNALSRQNFAQTNLTGHPGVTTMWLGATGLVTYERLGNIGWVDAHDPTLLHFFFRLPVALVTALCVGLAYPLLQRLFDWRVALLATLFWATDPFLVAHSQVLHVDALLTSFMTLSLLAVLVAIEIPRTANQAPRTGEVEKHQAPIQWNWLAVSATMGGLAMLTKSPAVMLPPIIGLILLISTLRSRNRKLKTSSRSISVLLPNLRLLFFVFSTWCFIAALVWLALWPAAWVNLTGAIESVINEVVDNGGAPHINGNFFLGRLNDNPGLLYYPVAVLLRITPWVLVGLIAAGVEGFKRIKNRVYMDQVTSNKLQSLVNTRSRATYNFLPILLLALFVIGFTFMMSLPPKKFDRYILPIFPTLNIIAAWGLIRLVFGILERWKSRTLEHFTWLVVILGLGINLAWYHPYEMSYYNPLVGGSKTAVWAMYVGWGEGLEQAGSFISSQFNGCDRPVATHIREALADFVCNDVMDMDAITIPGRVDYAVLYINHLQRHTNQSVVEQLIHRTPLHTVRIHGIDYAYIYQIPQPVAQTIDASFGSLLQLRGYGVDTTQLQDNNVIILNIHWQAKKKMTENYQLFIHVLNSRGEIVGQADVPPGGPRAPTSIWHSSQFVDWAHPVPVEADLAPGQYWVALGVYHPTSFARLPLQGPLRPGAPDDGPNALFLKPMTIP